MNFLKSWNDISYKPDNTSVKISHLHTHFEFLYITEGEVTFKADNKDFHLCANQMIITKPLQVHQVLPLSFPYSRMGIHIDLTEIPQFENSFFNISALSINNQLDFPIIIQLDKTSNLFNTLNKIHEEELKKPSLNEIMRTALLYIFLIELSREYPELFLSNPIDPLINDILLYIHEHFAENISIQQLAEKNFISTTHFIRRFKKYTGKTPKEYINSYRISISKQLLIQKDYKMESIARKCGFYDANSFIRSFKKSVGITPKTYKEFNQNNHRSIHDL